jgi:hypothetical protein
MTHHMTDHLTFGLRKTKVKVHIVQKSRKSRENVPWDKSSHVPMQDVKPPTGPPMSLTWCLFTTHQSAVINVTHQIIPVVQPCGKSTPKALQFPSGPCLCGTSRSIWVCCSCKLTLKRLWINLQMMHADLRPLLSLTNGLRFIMVNSCDHSRAQIKQNYS